MSTSNKELVKKTKDILSELGHDVPVSHIYQLYSKLLGYKSWQIASAQGLDLTQALPSIGEFTPLQEAKLSLMSNPCLESFKDFFKVADSEPATDDFIFEVLDFIFSLSDQLIYEFAMVSTWSSSPNWVKKILQNNNYWKKCVEVSKTILPHDNIGPSLFTFTDKEKAFLKTEKFNVSEHHASVRNSKNTETFRIWIYYQPYSEKDNRFRCEHYLEKSKDFTTKVTEAFAPTVEEAVKIVREWQNKK